MIGLRLADVGASIALYTNVATLTGAGGASVAAWAVDNHYPARAALLWTNTGAAAVTIGSTEVPAQLRVGGNVVGVALFGGRQIVIDPGDSVWCLLPEGVAALGAAWSLVAPMTSGATVSVSVVARYLATTAPTATEAAAAVWAYVVEGTHTARNYLRIAIATLTGRHDPNGGGARTSVFFSPVDTDLPRVTAAVTNTSRGNPTIDGGD